MQPDQRILLLDRNRYHSLLIERELNRQSPLAVVSHFADVAKASDELSSNHYDIALIDFQTVSAADVAMQHRLFFSHGADPTFILLSPPDDSHAGHAMLQTVDTVVPKNDGFQALIPDVIKRTLYERPKRLAELLQTPMDGNDSLLRIITSTLAHEINNPLMTILGSSELLLDMKAGLDKDLESKVRMIHESAQRIQTRLSQLATLNRPNLRNSSSGYLITTQK